MQSNKTRQNLFDAFKRARLEGEAWVTYNNIRMKLVPPNSPLIVNRQLYKGFIRARVRGGILYGELFLMEGQLCHNIKRNKDSPHRLKKRSLRYLQDKDCFAIALEEHFERE